MLIEQVIEDENIVIPFDLRSNLLQLIAQKSG